MEKESSFCTTEISNYSYNEIILSKYNQQERIEERKPSLSRKICGESFNCQNTLFSHTLEHEKKKPLNLTLALKHLQ